MEVISRWSLVRRCDRSINHAIKEGNHNAATMWGTLKDIVLSEPVVHEHDWIAMPTIPDVGQRVEVQDIDGHRYIGKYVKEGLYYYFKNEITRYMQDEEDVIAWKEISEDYSSEYDRKYDNSDL